MADLSALLDKEASAEIEAILSEARERASEIVARAQEEAEALVRQRERSAQAQAGAARIRSQSSAQLEAASMRLRAQHQAVEAVFAAARGNIEALSKDAKAYAKVLEALLREAVDALGGAEVAAVVVHPDDRAAAESALKALKLETGVESDSSMRFGVQVRSGNNMTIENSLIQRLDALRDDLAAEVSDILFAAPEG